MNLKIVEQKLPNVQNRGKKDGKKMNRVSWICKKIFKGLIYVQLKSKKKRRKRDRKILEEIKLINLSNFLKTKVPRKFTNHLGTL